VAGNRFAHPQLLDQGLAAWTVPEIWLLNAPNPTHHIDVTDQFDRKIRALRQTGHRRGIPPAVATRDSRP
jgi:hypothetical protein